MWMVLFFSKSVRMHAINEPFTKTTFMCSERKQYNKYGKVVAEIRPILVYTYHIFQFAILIYRV